MSKIFLAQTDTTVGFLSTDEASLNRAKKRPLQTPCIKCVSSFKNLHQRVPKKFKNCIRKAKKTTFIYPNGCSIRVSKDKKHNEFLSKYAFLYSTSANITGEKFDEAYARSAADEVIESDFFEGTASKMYKLSRENIKRIR